MARARPRPVTEITDPRWLRAVSHPIRIRLLAMLEEEESSPVLLASRLEQPLGTVAYHVRTLYDLGLLKLVSTRQRRGATEHYYRALSRPHGSDEAWGKLGAVSKQRLLSAELGQAHEYATRAAAAGGFDSPDAQLSSGRLQLDAEGFSALAGETRTWLAKAEQIQRESASRVRGDPASKLDAGLCVMLFEAPAAPN